VQVSKRRDKQMMMMMMMSQTEESEKKYFRIVEETQKEMEIRTIISYYSIFILII